MTTLRPLVVHRHVLTAWEHRLYLMDETFPEVQALWERRARYLLKGGFHYEVWHPRQYLLYPDHAYRSQGA
jgi:hypothetical protein